VEARRDPDAGVGEQYGGKVWGRLDDDEVRELSIHMSTLGTVSRVVEDQLLESCPNSAPAADGNFEPPTAVAPYLPTERVTGIMDEIRGLPAENVGEDLQCRKSARQLLKNVIPADHCGGASKLKPEHAPACWRSCPRISRSTSSAACENGSGAEEVIERVESDAAHDHVDLSQTPRDAHEVMPKSSEFRPPDRNPLITSLEEEIGGIAERIKR